MSTLGTRPKSVALVNAGFGVSFATILLASLGITQQQSGPLALTTLLAGLFATFLVIVNPIDFLFRQYLARRLTRQPPVPVAELQKGMAQSNLEEGLKAIVVQVFSDSFFGYERSSLISVVYLLVTFVWLIYATFAILGQDVGNLTLAILIILIAIEMLVIKFVQMIRQAPDKIGIIAAYSLILRRPSLSRAEDVDSFRRALSEGNWFEAEGWRTRIDLAVQPRQSAASTSAENAQQEPASEAVRTPTLEATMKLTGAAIGSFAVIAEIANVGNAGATEVVATITYTPQVREAAQEGVGALGPNRSKNVVLDMYVSNAELQQAETINLFLELKDERGNSLPELSKSFSVATLLEEQRQEMLRRTLGV